MRLFDVEPIELKKFLIQINNPMNENSMWEHIVGGSKEWGPALTNICHEQIRKNIPEGSKLDNIGFDKDGKIEICYISGGAANHMIIGNWTYYIGNEKVD